MTSPEDYVTLYQEWAKLKAENEGLNQLLDSKTLERFNQIEKDNKLLKISNEYLQQKATQGERLRELIQDSDVQQVITETIQDYCTSITRLKLSKDVADSIVRKCEKLQQLLNQSESKI